jgi:DNA-binding transcriptional LysR family regulator
MHTASPSLQFQRLVSRGRLKHLQLAVRIAELRSLQKAAASIGLSQPAATHALAELESALGCPLFERHARGMTPTPTGVALLPLIRNVLRLMQACADTVAFRREGATGIVRIGATGSGISGLLVRALPLFSAANPDVVVEVVDVSIDELTQVLESNRVDMIVCREAHPVPAGLRFLPIASDRFVVACGVDHPLARSSSVSDEDLRRHRWLITPLTGISPEALDEFFSRFDSPPRTCKMSSRSVLLTKAMLDDCELLALIPYNLIRPLVEAGGIAILPVPPIEMPPLGLLMPVDRTVGLAHTRVIESLMTWTDLSSPGESHSSSQQ